MVILFQIKVQLHQMSKHASKGATPILLVMDMFTSMMLKKIKIICEASATSNLEMFTSLEHILKKLRQILNYFEH